MKYIKQRKLFEESKYKDLKEQYGSIGLYVESLLDGCSDKERFLQVVNKYLIDYNPQIRISNAVEQIDTLDKMVLVEELEREFLNVSESLNDDIQANQFGGKGSFNSFIKVISAMGVKELNRDNKKCSKDYIVLYDCKNLVKDDLIRVLSRYQSLGLAKKSILEKEGNYGLYYSVKFNQKLYVEYGLLISEEKKKIGEFNLNTSNLRSLLGLKSKVLANFTDDFNTADLTKLITLSKIKMELDSYEPGYYQQKDSSYIDTKNYVVNLDVCGLGEWSGPNSKEGEVEKYKSAFNEWILSKKWGEYVLTSVSANKFWFKFKIKMK